MSHHYEIEVLAVTEGGMPVIVARRERPDKPGPEAVEELLEVLADLHPFVEDDTDHFEINVSAVTERGDRTVLARRKRIDKPGRDAVEELLTLLEDVNFVECHGAPSRPVGPSKPEYMPKTPRERLGYLIEECGEVLQIAGKSLRYGYRSFNPELPYNERVTNAVLMQREIANVEAAIAMVRRDIEDFPTNPDEMRHDGPDMLWKN